MSDERQLSDLSRQEIEDLFYESMPRFATEEYKQRKEAKRQLAEQQAQQKEQARRLENRRKGLLALGWTMKQIENK
jgi:hypothetical protein